jgi:hypothetical protein
VAWNGATKAAQFEAANQKLGNALPWIDLAAQAGVPGMKTVGTVADIDKILGQAMGSSRGQAALQSLAKLPVNTPEFAAQWNLVKGWGVPLAKTIRSPTAAPYRWAAPATAVQIQDRNPDQNVVDLRKWGFSGGGALERIKRNTLASLYR